MKRTILSLAGLDRKYGEPGCNDTIPIEDVRAVATEAALATAVDASPAILVALWAHDQRLHPEGRAPCRRTG